ncbi:hypothetical protein X474_15420 [Dethiosulfatarculus sandiegensis]|uniref:Uncharacterized protein n=1 Tax=Dethiosulfatarculus sandiegensis TaxID=1429043 RepID=A0A0D2J4T8_9BACT|nr:hypothetical protein X474_15420 [Dethiosulfatarculus sandiegensis]
MKNFLQTIRRVQPPLFECFTPGKAHKEAGQTCLRSFEPELFFLSLSCFQSSDFPFIRLPGFIFFIRGLFKDLASDTMTFCMPEDMQKLLLVKAVLGKINFKKQTVKRGLSGI